MIAKRELLCERIGSIGTGLGLCAVLVVPGFALRHSTGFAWIGLLYALVYVLMAELRRHVRMFIVFVAAHAALAVGTFALTRLFTDDILTSAFVLVQLALFIMLSFSRRLRNNTELRAMPDNIVEVTTQFYGSDVPDVATLLFVGGGVVFGWLLLHFAFEVNAEDWQMLGYGAMLFVYFVCQHIDSVNSAVVMAERVTEQPTQGILKYNNRIGAMMLSFVALFLILAPVFRLDKLIMLLLLGLLTLLQFALQFFAFLMSLVPLFETTNDTPPEPSGSIDLTAMFGGSETPNDGVITDVIIYIVAGAVAIALLAFVVYLVYDMYRRFNTLSPDATGYENRSHVSLVQEQRTGTSIFGGFRAMAAQLFGNSARMKVRRLFTKKVRGYSKKKAVAIGRAETSAEIAKTLSSCEDLTTLRILYDKARYDEADLTKDELSTLR